MSLRQSYGDEEDIVVKPSTELISDEYEHFMKTTYNIAVHTFASKYIKDQDNVNLFIATLSKNGYQIKSENAHCLENDNIPAVVKDISENTEGLGGLILFFSGFCQSEGNLNMFNGEDIVSTRIQEIWNKFTSYTCLGLKNRPKIFIFQVTSPTTTETDSKRYLSTTFDLAYETPAEADMLIVYNKTENSYQRDFTEQLCDNINRYGKNEDIISLVTCTDSIVFETRPMIISTLTRKFYFTVSESRGYHLTIDQNNEELMRGLREVDVKLSQVSHSEKKKRFFSFKNIGKKNSVKNEAPKEVKPKEVKPKEDDDIFRRDTNIRNSNIKNVITKSRNVSQSDSDGSRSNLTRKSIDEKPRWRYAFKK